jgi:hypothetical protein
VLRDDVFGELAIEEGADGTNATAARDIGDVYRRLDAEMPDATLLEMSQHDAVIAAELDDEGIGLRGQKILHHRPGEGLEVLLHVT